MLKEQGEKKKFEWNFNYVCKYWSGKFDSDTVSK